MSRGRETDERMYTDIFIVQSQACAAIAMPTSIQSLGTKGNPWPRMEKGLRAAGVNQMKLKSCTDLMLVSAYQNQESTARAGETLFCDHEPVLKMTALASGPKTARPKS